MLLQTLSAVILAWRPAAVPPLLSHVPPRVTTPMCADVYGRVLSPAPQHEEVTTEAAEALKDATKCLSAHDKASLAMPNAAIPNAVEAVEEYYVEYLEALRDAVRVLSEHSNSVMLGFMGDDASQTVHALRSWQSELGLSKPPLRVLAGEDQLSPPLPDSVATGPSALRINDTVVFGSTTPAFLKFNSRSDFNMLKPHQGPFRGVIITANLKEGSVRQFGGLPLALFQDVQPRPPGLKRWIMRRGGSFALATAMTTGPAACRAVEPLMLGSLAIARDPVDYYYLLIVVGALGYYGKQLVTSTIDEAKDYDRRGELANAMAAEQRKRERAAAREAVKQSDPAYRRLQAEAEQRATKRDGWKQFPAFKEVLDSFGAE